MDWFLYDNGLRHERVKTCNRSNETKKQVGFFHKIYRYILDVQYSSRFESLKSLQAIASSNLIMKIYKIMSTYATHRPIFMVSKDLLSLLIKISVPHISM